MPSGGGSFGGGGGGGGFSGGGYSGGGYSSYHSHHYYGGHYRSGRRATPAESCFWGIVTVVIIIVIVMIILMVTYLQDVNTEGDTFYSPGDSRLIELDTLFCDRVSLSESSPSTTAELYLLTRDEIPPITDKNNFTISPVFNVGGGEFQFWQYHLYPGSNVSISACIQSGTSVTLYVIRGNSNYNDWKNSGSSNHAFQTIFISQQCSGVARGGIAFTIKSEDEWYFAFANTGSGIDQISANLTFERFQYTTSTLTDISQTCDTVSSDDCSVDVGFRSSRKYALIVTSIPSGTVDWGENVDVEWKCARNHGGYFLVTGVPIFSLIFLILLFVGGGLLAVYIIKNKHKFNRIHLPSVSTVSIGTTSRRMEVSEPVTTSFVRSENIEDDVPEEVKRMNEASNAPPPYPGPGGSYTSSEKPPPPPYGTQY